MYRIPQRPQPYKEDVELMKRGRKRKSTTTTRTKGVNIKNIINISRGGGGGRRRPPVSSPAVNYPYANLFRPQLNEPRSTAVTSAISAEQNNNILASFRKTQEISEGKLNAKIDDMGSKLQESIMNIGRMEDTKSFLQELELEEEQSQLDKQRLEELKIAQRNKRTPKTPKTPTSSTKGRGRPRRNPKPKDDDDDEKGQ
jgi:hypothetical protein